MNEKSITILPNSIIHLGSVDKLNEIVHNFRENLITITFSSEHCGACRSFSPIYAEVQKEFFKEGVIFLSIDVTQLPEIAEQFSIRGTPTTLFIHRQKVKKHQVGLIPKGQLHQIIRDLLKLQDNSN